MHVTLLDTQRIVSNSFHNAFTSLCHWRGMYWLAYREAPYHGIIPPGVIEIIGGQEPAHLASKPKLHGITLALPYADLRDPKLIATDDRLWLMCGAYLRSPHLRHYGIDALTNQTQDAQVWTFLTSTRDGVTWAPLRPILRPNSWGWSVIQAQGLWHMNSYDVSVFDTRATVTLWSGVPDGGFTHCGVIYDGGSLEKEAGTYRYTALMPSEPVLYAPTRDTLACCLRTESTMLLGTGRTGTAWRWQDTHELLHPSAIIATLHGWLLAARQLTERRTRGRQGLTYDAQVTLWHLDGNRLRKVLTLQANAGDCAYCGLCETDQAGEYLVSYYASHDAPIGLADIYIGRIHLSD